MDSSPKSEIILYQPNETVSLEVRLDEETVWLTLNQMSILFGRDKSVISRHIATIFKEEELEREATVAKNATVQNENGRTVLRTIEYYNLDVIISVGYRVNSRNATLFRQWANKVLKEYL
ncbi:MAG: virulence RhuM family protein, partial [Bacteroidales bacterium]|nr:virulence RhuM family protein [Bacteroidales bacterium]